MMNPFAFDFGYGWAWNYGHLIAVVSFGPLAALAWRRRWPRWIRAMSVALAVWGLAGLVIVQLVIRTNLPLELPTEQFLAEGSGQVLDAGAGSGRSSLMVLLARPGSRVLALDLYSGYYGIADNRPERLFANAARAGVEDRIEARVGDMRAMPLGDESVDAAVSAYAIDHLSSEGVERSLAEIQRVLRPNGQFLLMVINPDVWIRIAYPFFVHHGYFGPRTDHQRWRSHLTTAGFDVVEQGTTPGTLYLLARKREEATRAARPGSTQ
jgi:SAM-dependent methyltransferase